MDKTETVSSTMQSPFPRSAENSTTVTSTHGASIGTISECRMVSISEPIRTPMHESFSIYFYEHLAREIASWLQEILPGCSVRPSGSATKRVDPGLDKEPDAGLFVWRGQHHGLYPNMVVEVGYTATREDLEMDARDWLWGSEGQVRSVILVKVTGPAPESDDFCDETKWEGYLEIHTRSEKSNSTQRDTTVQTDGRAHILPYSQSPPSIVIRLEDLISANDMPHDLVGHPKSSRRFSLERFVPFFGLSLREHLSGPEFKKRAG